MGAFAGGKGELEKGGLAPGPDGAYVGFDQGVAARKALRTQALPDLGGTLGIRLEHLANLGLEGIELARARRALARPEALLAQPIGDGFGIEAQNGRNLGRLEVFAGLQVLDLTKLMIINHDNTSPMRSKTALRSIASSVASGNVSRGGVPKAKTW